MNTVALIARMESFPRNVAALTSGISDYDTRWKPPSGAWSILEIVCHLTDEEVGDFRARIESTLRDPAAPWSPIDPEQAAIDGRYNEQDLTLALERLTSERGESIRWLHMLLNPEWTTSHEHPSLGSITAGDLLLSWAAHDALHLRQIAKRLFELAERDMEGFSPAYAGAWS